MWKEIGIGLIMLCILRSLLDVYMVKKYNKIVRQYGSISTDLLKKEACKHLVLCEHFAVGPFNKNIYLIYNGLCWLLASICLMEDNEKEFLNHLNRVRREREFELKPFALALFYFSKNDNLKAEEWHRLYLESTHHDDRLAVIMSDIFENQSLEKTMIYELTPFNNPALYRLINACAINIEQRKTLISTHSIQ